MQLCQKYVILRESNRLTLAWRTVNLIKFALLADKTHVKTFDGQQGQAKEDSHQKQVYVKSRKQSLQIHFSL